MKRIRDAQTIIGMLESGTLAQELGTTITDALAKLKDQCGNRPKATAKGKVTLTLDLEVEAGAVTISADIASKLPKMPRATSYFWVTDDGSLTTEHPQQMNMFAGPRDTAVAG